VNFALYSENAAWVELCLYDVENPSHEVARLRLREVIGHVFHGYVRGIRPGQPYGYRVHGDYAPERGLRFNAAKLLVDPYARSVAGEVDWSAAVFPYPLGHKDEDLARDEQDNGWGMPKSVVIDSTFDWEGDRQPRIPWHETVIYETHVRGLTIRHPDVPEELRGTYAGLATRPVIRYLKALGITAVELMPVHTFIDEKHIVDRGLHDYWGYTTLNYFSPEARYACAHPGGEVAEFKAMVRALHKAGIEVILDWSTTMRAKATTWGRCSRSRESTTRPTIVSYMASRASTWTTPVRATRSTRGTRRSSS
jgi:glycogen operon protein